LELVEDEAVAASPGLATFVCVGHVGKGDSGFRAEASKPGVLTERLTLRAWIAYGLLGVGGFGARLLSLT
jgi:hypothetical protein